MMTDLREALAAFPVARRRRISARVRPVPRAPTLRKVRRVRPSQERYFDPRKVSMGWSLDWQEQGVGTDGRAGRRNSTWRSAYELSRYHAKRQLAGGGDKKMTNAPERVGLA